MPPPAPFTSPGASPRRPSTRAASLSGAPAPRRRRRLTQTILLGNRPIQNLPGFGETTVTTQVVSTNRYFIEGAYYTLRVGPTLILPMGKQFKLTIERGPALIYAGSEYNVLEDLVYATGEPALTQLYQKENTKLLPGYYVDVNLQYDLTETAGFYVGGSTRARAASARPRQRTARTSYTTSSTSGARRASRAG